MSRIRNSASPSAPALYRRAATRICTGPAPLTLPRPLPIELIVSRILYYRRHFGRRFDDGKRQAFSIPFQRPYPIGERQPTLFAGSDGAMIVPSCPFNGPTAGKLNDIKTQAPLADLLTSMRPAVISHRPSYLPRRPGK
ncbi:hypothetical protein REMIM1_PF00911 (plasmid) [Rhizobium etli bv. mimosae str. Mim1]|nr:hypothetical protein REMIM1_PF00911 [Rhizobium etli bv. mimosae str. Mim1]